MSVLMSSNPPLSAPCWWLEPTTPPGAPSRPRRSEQRQRSPSGPGRYRSTIACSSAAIPGTSTGSAATRITRLKTSPLEAVVGSVPLRSRKTAQASQPSRLLPSTSAWSFTSECSKAAAFDQISGYASSPNADARGRATAALSRPRSRTGGGSPRRAVASSRRSPTQHQRSVSRGDRRGPEARGTAWPRASPSSRAGRVEG